MFKSKTYKQSLFARSLSLLLAFTFIVHTGYVNATTMECYTSGRSEVSLLQKDFCCAVEALDFSSVSPKCCAFEQTQKVFDGFTGEDSFELKKISFPSITFGLVEILTPLLRKADSASLKSPPDPLSGLSLLKYISVFRL
ncbi:hypothetical protein O3Q51_03900 [Cryomorphaceae bacterium 1068]|nr:hypothetical protein [Cryomorphaceae bacterium 1068]